MSAGLLVSAERALGTAIAMRDRKVLESLAHPSLTYVGFRMNGKAAWSRADWIKSILNLGTISFVHTAADVQVLGRAAVVTVDAVWIGRSGDVSKQQRILMSDTWILAQERWRLLRRHASRAEEVLGEAAPAEREAALI